MALLHFPAMALKIPCLVDDSAWGYGSGLFTREISKNLKLCPKAYKNERLFYTARLGTHVESLAGIASKTLPAIPQRVEERLRGCHEDVQLWYVGVIVEFILQHTEGFEKKLNNIVSERTNLSAHNHYHAIHIRSTDKRREAALLRPDVYARLKFMHIIFPELQDDWKLLKILDVITR